MIGVTNWNSLSYYLDYGSIFIIAEEGLTGGGDLTSSVNLALSDTGVSPGTYNDSSSQTQSFTVDQKGRITDVGSPTDITLNWDSVTSKPTTLNGFGITGGYVLNDVGFGTNNPQTRLHAVKTSEQLRLGYNDSVYTSFTVNNQGNILINSSGSGSILLGSANDHIKITTTGNLSFEGASTVWDDLLTEMKESLQGSNLKPDWDSTNLGLLFPRNDTGEYIDLNIQMPHRWKEGTTVYPHVHFLQNQNAVPTFMMNYRWFNIGDPVPSFTTGLAIGTIVGSQTWTSRIASSNR